MKSLLTLLFLIVYTPVFAFELGTTVSRTEDIAKIETVGYAKLILLKQETSLKGKIIATGTLSIQGTANVVMWSKVEGAYYFSRLPSLQNIQNGKNMAFQIPFNAGNKTVTEVLIQVEMLSEGNMSISGMQVKNG